MQESTPVMDNIMIAFFKQNLQIIHMFICSFIYSYSKKIHDIFYSSLGFRFTCRDLNNVLNLSVVLSQFFNLIKIDFNLDLVK